ncbi:unnamed protein product [Cuscuta europaea]|uniref:Uncharacterized protein n=1 Tax=Cuscuta europaea TaxID=41803 RepID=A0A9P0YH24_CUSEU|nr:unnamed protein product [Cuscuta europaea]
MLHVREELAAAARYREGPTLESIIWGVIVVGVVLTLNAVCMGITAAVGPDYYEIEDAIYTIPAMALYAGIWDTMAFFAVKAAMQARGLPVERQLERAVILWRLMCPPMPSSWWAEGQVALEDVVTVDEAKLHRLPACSILAVLGFEFAAASASLALGMIRAKAVKALPLTFSILLGLLFFPTVYVLYKQIMLRKRMISVAAAASRVHPIIPSP